jgi:hypothetical protein
MSDTGVIMEVVIRGRYVLWDLSTHSLTRGGDDSSEEGNYSFQIHFICRPPRVVSLYLDNVLFGVLVKIWGS